MTTLKQTTESFLIPPGPLNNVSVSDTIDSLPFGVLVIDSQLIILHANLDAARFLGLPCEKLEGLKLERFWPKTAGEIALALSGGRQAIGLVPSEAEGCYIHVKPLPGMDAGAAVTIFDQRMPTPLAREGADPDPLSPYYKQILDASTDFLAVVDHKGRVLLINETGAARLGVAPEVIQGRSVSYLVENNYTNDVISFDVLATGRKITRLLQYTKTGRHILFSGTPLIGPAGEVLFVVINERDLTEQLELQSALEKERMLAGHYKEELSELRMAELAERELVARSPAMLKSMETAAKLSRYDTRQILITGESGVGKGLLAKFIHSKSKRASEPFIHINCAALPEQLLEAELFGYEKGTFVGAAPEGRAGIFEVASKGTAHLDEIDCMPLGVQARLFAFLDTRTFRRAGGNSTLSSDCSIIASTNQDLRELCDRKLFRPELYFRLNVFCLSLPPLRDRRDDIMELAGRELSLLNQRYGQNKELDALALEVLLNHPFPGNVRELLNCLHQAVLLSDKPQIGGFLAQLLDQAARREGCGGGRPNPTRLHDNIADTERNSLDNALKVCRNTREMAALLGISQAGVSRKLRKYGLPLPKNRNGMAGREKAAKSSKKES
ncbi:MAG: sigma 54-interacting transcriptional regulator, partial [Deltaproteobacteria bacterium]|nr:sigma 54-interacting transcriptional regulator [Deltaproteobacteria bacterium]